MRAPVGLKFGTIKRLRTADLSTKFGRNPMSIHGVMTDYLRKIKSNFCHAHRVNPLKECAENYHVDGVTIIRPMKLDYQFLAQIFEYLMGAGGYYSLFFKSTTHIPNMKISAKNSEICIDYSCIK